MPLMQHGTAPAGLQASGDIIPLYLPPMTKPRTATEAARKRLRSSF
jgi:hypothetical protein